VNGPGDSDCQLGVGCAHTPPRVDGLTVFEPNYCLGANGFAQVSIQWTYNDPDGNHETAFYLEMDDNDDFSSPEINDRNFEHLDNNNLTVNTQIISIQNQGNPDEGDYLSFGTTYYVRVKVVDSTGLDSGWVDGTPLTTAIHPYPATEFTNLPRNPQPEEEVNFLDLSLCYGLPGGDPFQCQTMGIPYVWDFGDNQTDSTAGNVEHTYSVQGNYNVKLDVCDQDDLCCRAIHTVTVKIPSNNPKSREIWPFR